MYTSERMKHDVEHEAYFPILIKYACTPMLGGRSAWNFVTLRGAPVLFARIGSFPATSFSITHDNSFTVITVSSVIADISSGEDEDLSFGALLRLLVELSWFPIVNEETRVRKLQ